MKYRPDIAAVVDRYRKFYASEEPGALLVHVFVPPAGSLAYDLRDYDFPDPDENARYIRTYIENRRYALEARLGVMDDYVPEINSHHGIALMSAYVAGEPVMG